MRVQTGWFPRWWFLIVMMSVLAACQEQDISTDIAEAEFRGEPEKVAQADSVAEKVISEEQAPGIKEQVAVQEKSPAKKLEAEPQTLPEKEQTKQTENKIAEVIAETAKPAPVVAQESVSKGNVENGRKVAKKCQSCHTLGSGEKIKVGPNLFGIIGRAQGSVSGFQYGTYLQSSGKVWQEEDLRAWVDDSTLVAKQAGKKTKMSAQHVSGEKADDLIAYLKTLK